MIIDQKIKILLMTMIRLLGLEEIRFEERERRSARGEMGGLRWREWPEKRGKIRLPLFYSLWFFFNFLFFFLIGENILISNFLKLNKKDL